MTTQKTKPDGLSAHASWQWVQEAVDLFQKSPKTHKKPAWQDMMHALHAGPMLLIDHSNIQKIDGLLQRHRHSSNTPLPISTMFGHAWLDISAIHAKSAYLQDAPSYISPTVENCHTSRTHGYSRTRMHET